MMNGILYKWEDNHHGLDHKCGTCKTVLSSPRAKKTCFGVHEEVCIRYHGTLHFLGSSHRCDACRKTIELHDKRHKKIARIVQKIHGIDGAAAEDFADRSSGTKMKTRKSDALGQEDGGQWADTGTTCDEKNTRGPINPTPEHQGEGAEKMISGNEKEDVEKLCTPYMKGNESIKKAKKVEKQSKRTRNMTPGTTTEVMKRIDEALHPTRVPLGNWSIDDHQRRENPLVNNSTIDANIAFNPHTFKYSSLRQSVQTKRQAREDATPRTHSKGANLLDDRTLVLILSELNISTDIVFSSKERTPLITQLIEAIHEDLTTFANDERETMMRMAGYWRYANRHTYNTMVRNNELWEWSTGQKLEEIKEDGEVEPKDHVSGPGSRSISGDRSKVQAVENYDQDFESEVKKLALVAIETDRTRNFALAYDGLRDRRHLRRRQRTDVPSAEAVLPVTPVRVTPKFQTNLSESSVRFESAPIVGGSMKDTPCQIDKEEADDKEDEEEEDQQSTGIWSANRFAALADPNLLPEVEKKSRKTVLASQLWPPIALTRSNKSQKKSRKIGYFNTLSKGL